MSLREGSVIEFKDKKSITGVLCLKVDSKNVRVINESNKEFNLPINKISHITDHVLNTSKSRSELISDLNNLINKIEEKIGDINISDLWELLKDETEEKYTLKQLTEIYFGNDISSDMRSCMLRLLVEDSTYFEIKSDGAYSPKPEKIVEQIINQKKIEEQRLKLRENSIQWLKEVWTNNKISEQPEGIEKILESLKEVAVLGNRSEKYNDVFNLVSESGINISHSEENLIKLLTRLKIFEEDQNLLLIEYNIPLSFSKNIINESKNINNDIFEETNKRIDLRAIDTITIDDEDTKDIDDAISFVENKNGSIVYIHIADAAHWIKKDSILDKEAQARSTTMYLPERKIEMLPPNLSEDTCSLIEGQDRLAISVIIDFNEINEISSFKIVESIINVNKKMSYKEADEKLNSDSTLLSLSELTNSLREMRLNKGAIIFNLPELKIKITEDKEIIFDKYKQNSPSQLLVSELMILANSLVAEYMFKNKIPCIYRHQEEPVEIVDFNTDINPVIMMYKQRRFMKKSEVSTIPQDHHGLGLKYYTQMTSPIRRYSDMVVHRQLKSFLNDGVILYSEDQIKEIINFSEHSIYVANLIQRNANRYWICKFLSKEIGNKTPALVLEVLDDRSQVQLSDFLIELPLFKELGYKPEVGQEIEVIIKDVQIRKGFIAIKLLKEPNEEIKKIEYKV